jgi:hypothetical protein
MGKLKIWIPVLLIIGISFFVYWNYYNTFSEGNRSGILQKFSKKGNIFKTYEGELVMSSITTTGNTMIASEKFFFSVKDPVVAEQLFEMEGKNVTLRYEEKRGHLPWNGETNYYITGIVSKK